MGEIGVSHAHPSSTAPAMLRILQRDLRSDLGESSGPGASGDPRENSALAAIENASTQMAGPLQDVEFVAKRLLWGQGRRTDHVLLGTPLYVAMAD